MVFCLFILLLLTNTFLCRLGPSYTVDTACSSSFVALSTAYNDIADGRVDAALVNAGELCLNPVATKLYWKSGIVSPTCDSSPFDETGEYIAHEFRTKLKLLIRSGFRK